MILIYRAEPENWVAYRPPLVAVNGPIPSRTSHALTKEPPHFFLPVRLPGKHAPAPEPGKGQSGILRFCATIMRRYRRPLHRHLEADSPDVL